MLVAVLAGTAGTAGTGGSPAAAGPPRAPAPAPAPEAARTAADDDGCDPLASLRPKGKPPKAGSMPEGSTMEKIVKRGRLVAGVDQNTYLFGYRNPLTGTIEGFDIDVLHEISRALFGDPDRIQYKTMTNAGRIPAVTGGEVDIVAHSMTITCDRMEKVLFSTDYLDSGQRVLVPSDSSVESMDDLGGKRVCSAAGTTSIAEIEKHPAGPLPVAVKDWTDCLMLLQQRQVDAVSTTDNVLAGLLAQDPYTKLVGPRFTREPHGLAVSKSTPDLVRFVNAVLERMRDDGTWTDLHERWLGDLGDEKPPPARYRD